METLASMSFIGANFSFRIHHNVFYFFIFQPHFFKREQDLGTPVDARRDAPVNAHHQRSSLRAFPLASPWASIAGVSKIFLFRVQKLFFISCIDIFLILIRVVTERASNIILLSYVI